MDKKQSSGIRKDGATVTVDLDACVSAGPCAVIALKTFKIRDSDHKAVVVDPDGDNFSTILEAAQACPVNAIILIDKNGKKIYPKE